MKLNSKFLVSLFIAVLPLGVTAQTAATADLGPHAGSREITIGGSGASNRQFSDSVGGLSLSIGQFLNETQELSIRQSINYSNPDFPGARQEWNGATRLAFDQHFGTGALRPFVGVNVGGIYGRSVTDSWTAGIEAGIKYYVHPQTFVFATPEYDWAFRHASGFGHRFNDGQFNWVVGVGFNL